MTTESAQEIRVVSASGVCGSGFREESLEEAMGRKPHFIGCDGGSTDPGPYPLGAGVTSFPRVSIKRDLKLMLRAARQSGIPLLLGTAGTSGGEPHLAIVTDIIKEIAAEEGLKFPMAVIHAEQNKDYLKQPQMLMMVYMTRDLLLMDKFAKSDLKEKRVVLSWIVV